MWKFSQSSMERMYVGSLMSLITFPKWICQPCKLPTASESQSNFFPAHSSQAFKNFIQNFKQNSNSADTWNTRICFDKGRKKKKQNQNKTFYHEKIITVSTPDQNIHWQHKYLDYITILFSLWCYQPNTMPDCDQTVCSQLCFKYSSASADTSLMSHFFRDTRKCSTCLWIKWRVLGEKMRKKNYNNNNKADSFAFHLLLVQTFFPGKTTSGVQKGAVSTSLVNIAMRANKKIILNIFFPYFRQWRIYLYKYQKTCFTISVYMYIYTHTPLHLYHSTWK